MTETRQPDELSVAYCMRNLDQHLMFDKDPQLHAALLSASSSDDASDAG